MLNYKYVIFDFDGTLVDSGEGVKKSVQYALASFGIIENDKAKLDRFLGPSLWDSFTKFYDVDDETATKMVETYRKRYRVQGVYESALYENIIPVLEALQKEGITLGIASSKPEFYVQKMAEEFHIASYFSALCGSSFENTNSDKASLIKRCMKELNADTAQGAIMVGDREYDILGAKQMHIDAVAALYGYGTYDELKKAGADFFVKQPEDLQTILLP